MKQNIEDRLKKSFYDLEIAPPTDLWEKIDATLVSKESLSVANNRKTKIVKLISTIAATAAVIILPFIILIINNNRNIADSGLSVGSEVAEKSKNDTVIENLAEEKEKINANMTVEILNSKITNKNSYQNKSNSTNITSVAYNPINSSDVIEKRADINTLNIEEQDSKIKQPTTIGNRVIKQEGELNNGAEKNKFIASAYNQKSAAAIKNKSNRVEKSRVGGYSISANGMGIGTGTEISRSVDNNTFQSSNDIKFATLMNSEEVYLFKTKIPIRNWTHNVPLSFGVNVRKMFTRNIGIETGITYTYLSSNSKAMHALDYDLSQHLHYLGIPISLVWNIYENKKISIYTKGGLLIDYAINAEEIKKYSSGKEVKKIDVNGVQYSAMINAGLGYKATSFLSFYLEPSLSYYFDNNQPMSYRTENNIGFGASLGVRFNL